MSYHFLINFTCSLFLLATSSQNCGVCELRHILRPSIAWCTECDEGLCTECHEHHSLSNTSRSHSLIPITEYQKLPTDLLKVTQYCGEQNEKYQIYCKKHESPCCSKCKTIKNVRISSIQMTSFIMPKPPMPWEIEETLVEVEKNLQKICQH
ncbi:unnamed protein product [Mytilus coruscus]|uniref:B box-type domain-containing protein n=1 Tax=Mytilus coruscus TaxID=42192 RepID=A0A6J8E9W3_MYTCO|nr:unnamed protein product [Mytilus coruscus]